MKHADGDSRSIPEKERQGGLSPGWKTAIAGTVMTFAGAGTYFSFGVFVPYLLQDFGWTRTEISGAASLRAVVTGLLTPVVGIAVDRFGTRKVAPFSIVLIGLGYLSLFWTHSLWQLYVSVGVILGVGLSASYVPVVALLLRLFRERSALPVGLLDSGRGMGQIFFSPFIGYMIAGFDWRLTFVALGLLVWILAAPFLFWIAPEPKAAEKARAGTTPLPDAVTSRRGHSFREALKSGRFWIILLVYFVNSFGFMMVLFHVVAYARDRQVPEPAAALIVTAAGLFSVIGALLAGALSRRIGNRVALMAGLAVQIPALLLLTGAGTAVHFYATVALFALGYGAVFPLMPTIAGEVFGTRAAGGLVGSLGMSFTLGILLGPLFAGYIFDTTGSYSPAFITAAAAIFLLLFCLLPLKPYPKGEAKP